MDSRGIQWPFKEGDILTEDEDAVYLKMDNSIHQVKKLNLCLKILAENPLQLH